MAEEVFVQVIAVLLPEFLEKWVTGSALVEDASGLIQIRGGEEQHDVGIRCEGLPHALEVGRVVVDRVPGAEIDDSAGVFLKHTFTA